MCRWILIAMLVLPISVKCQIITTIAGTGVVANTGDGGPASAAALNYPSGLAFDREGNLYIALGNSGHKVRKISTAGIITTVAGTGIAGYSGDGGPATAAKLNNAPNIAIDSLGNIFIADAGNNVIRRVDKLSGIITTIAGTGVAGYSGDGGPATNAQLYIPNGICFDKSGNLYFGDNGNYRVRKINTSGIISHVAGTGTASYSGDGGLAATTSIFGVFGLCIDEIGDLYVADGFSRICKINILGIITTYVGTSTSGSAGDEGPATIAQIYPLRIAFDKAHNLYIAENSPNNKVRVVDAAGIIHTAAGNGLPIFGGDGGPATAASIYYPAGVATDACGSLYISDLDSRRIRKVTYPPILTIPTISITGDVSKPVGSMVSINATVSNAGSSYVIHWINKGVEFTTTTVPSVTYTKAAGIDTITARVVSTATYGCYDSTTSGGWVVTTSGVWISPQPSPKEREVL